MGNWKTNVFISLMFAWLLMMPCYVMAQGQTIKRSHTGKSKIERNSTSSRTGRKNSGVRNVEAERKRIIDNLISNMVYVQGGTFMMGATPEQGSDAEDDEKPVHQVTLSSFSIGKYEMTQREWKAIMGNNPSGHKGDNFPVENVSWEECQTFINRLNSITGKQFRLPTEAEWEFAARGGIYSKGYKYAGSNNIKSVAWYSSNFNPMTGYCNEKTHSVGVKRPNELGLYDMSGNVAEWCEDWYGDYDSQAQEHYRVIRGGGWYGNAENCRVSNRSYNEPSGTWGHVTSIGFRLVM